MPFKEIPFFKSKRFSRILALNCSVFLYLFLVFFQPFGVNNYKMHSVFSWDLILGLLPIIPVVFFTIYLSERYLRPVFQRSLGPGRFLWHALEFFLVGSFSFLLYNALGNFHDFHFRSYLLHLLEVTSILIFPFAATHFYFRYRNLEQEHKEVLSLSDDLSRMDQLLKLKGDYKKDEITLKPKNIVCLVSEDNYVGLIYFEGEELKKYLIRSSLTNMEEALSSNYFFRCHRSYLINLNHVVSYQRIRGRIQIKLNGYERDVPVSRGAEKQLMAGLKNL